MIEKFVFWLCGIVEDDPLPDEIQCILFIVKSNGNYKYLEMQGYEKGVDFTKLFYRPLEAEFFDIRELVTSNKNVFEYRLKSLIDEAFSSEVLKQQFIGRKIYIFINHLEYLFLI